MISPSAILRGHIYYVNWDEESEAMEKTRPSLVVQNNAGNVGSPYTIVVAIHEDKGKRIRVIVPVQKGVAGLTKNSVVDCGAIATIPRDNLLELVGVLPHPIMDQVDKALKISLALR